jgi:hypothetical protein
MPMGAESKPLLDLSSAPEPPWARYPGRAPWWGGWRQGDAEPWYLHVFLPFWAGLGAEQRLEYLGRWPPPDADWAENLALNRTAEPASLNFDALPLPPWERYSPRGPRWIGWHLGAARRWLREDFLPFWLMLRPEDRAAYARRWPPPSEAWRERLESWERDDRA